MKWKASFRKLTALLLSVVLMLSLCTTAFATEGDGGEPGCSQLDGCTDNAHAEGCPLHQDPDDTPEPTPPTCNHTVDCAAGEHEDGCPKDPVVINVQGQINNLPNEEEINSSNVTTVKETLATIETAIANLNDAQKSALNLDKYDKATEVVKSLSPAPAESTPVEPTPTEPTLVEKVQAMINALPDTVTGDNAEDVESRLEAIDTEKLKLTDDELPSLDFTKYTAAANALGSYYDNMTLDNVAQIGNETYSTVNAAIQAIVEGNATGTIDVISSTSENIVIPAGANITLNLSAGVTLTNDPTDTKTHTIINNGTLTIKGSGTIDNISHGKGALYNNAGATATLDGCSYTRSQENGISAEDNGGNSWYNIKNFGTMTINAGVTVTQSGQYSSLVANGWQSYSNAGSGSEPASSTEAKLTINGGTFSGGLNTIKNDDNSILVINGGTFTNVAQYALMNWNVATINGGTFSTQGIKNTPAVWCGYDNTSFNKGILTITAGTFTAGGEAASVAKGYDGATVTITGGTYSSDVSAYVPDGYAATDESGNYIVGIATEQKDEHVAVVDGQYFKTLETAIGAASQGSTVTLLKPVNENVTIAKDAKVTLDLNGQTLTIPANSSMSVLGELTIQDSQTGGKITATSISNGSAIESDGGKVTLESGKIENSNGYGIYASSGGTATVNGGTIESLYAPLSGNNTTGNMNFEVNGGTLTAQQGPAIYMPGQMTLTITGGTLNGGISLRMGQVNISGGTVNAATSNLDSPAEYYNYSGNAWLPDALYVFGGTYTSNDATYGNSLNLNITGGTFNCTNGQGSGIAVYDLGNTSQDMKVAISGSTVVTTNAADRSAYQVLSLNDIGVTSPAPGYGNTANVGKVATAISGGTFSSEVAKEYCADGFYPNKNADGTYSVHVHNYGEPVFTWTDDNTCTVTTTCETCGDTLTETCTVTKKTIAATTTEAEKTVYTATATINGKTVTDTKTINGLNVLAILDGQDQSYALYSGDTITIRCSGARGDFVSISVDGEAVDSSNSSNYTVKSGSTVLTFSNSYLNTLSVGEHTVTMNYKEGVYTANSVSTTLTVTAGWEKLAIEVKANRTSVRPRKTITYTLTVTNNTGTDLTDIVVSNTVDKNLTFSSSSGSGTYTAKDGLWTIPELKAGKTAKITVKYTVKSGVKDGTTLVYASAITSAEAANGETLPDNVSPSGSVTVKVSNKISLIPGTGDTSNIGLWITVLAVVFVALVAVGIIAIIKTRKKK